MKPIGVKAKSKWITGGDYFLAGAFAGALAAAGAAAGAGVAAGAAAAGAAEDSADFESVILHSSLAQQDLSPFGSHWQQAIFPLWPM